jgi:hypothetical protein
MNNTQDLEKLVAIAASGYDYDIAKLFITMFPNNTFTDREISVKLSEDVHDLFAKEAHEAHLSSLETVLIVNQQRYQELAKRYLYLCEKMRSNARKSSVIMEIKMIR